MTVDGPITLRGGVNQVVRYGARVHRPAGPWTPAVHALLRHVAGTGFAGLPRVYGFDDSGREILEYIPGTVPADPPPAYVNGDPALTATARLLRDYHDATTGFVAPAGAVWYFPPRAPVQVICLGDVAPYNTVYRDGLPVAFIDVDTACPGPRLWDVGYAAYRFVPLTDPARDPGAPPLAEAARRLRLFCDAYRLPGPERRALIPAAAARLAELATHIETQAAAGHPAFARHLADGHPALYRADRDRLLRDAAALRPGTDPPAA